MVLSHSHGPDQGAAIAEQPVPYRLSVVNRLGEAVTRSRWPTWLVWATVIALLLGAEGALLVADGTWPGRVALIHVMLPVYSVMTPLSLHYRNRVALVALADSRELLSDDEVGVTWLQRVFQVLTWSGVGVTGYHILRQVLVVHEIYTRHARIDLFTPGPLYALSRLSAFNTLFTIAVGAVGAAAVAPGLDLASSPTTRQQWVVFLLVMLVVAGASFIAPLYGAHRLLVAEKNAALDALGTQTESVIAMVKSRVEGGELSDAGEVNALLEALSASRAAIDRIRTWPWEPDTARAVVTALVAPVVIYVVTQVLDSWL